LPNNAKLYCEDKEVVESDLNKTCQPDKITIDPDDGNQTVVFKYITVDKAGVESNEANVTMPFVTKKKEIQAQNDEKEGVVGKPVKIDILENDTKEKLDPSTVNLNPDSANGVGEDTDGDGDIDKVVVEGEGVWSVDNNGTLIFTPEEGFVSDPTPLEYSVKDKNGQLQDSAIVKIKYNSAVSIYGYVWYDENVDGINKDEVNVVDVKVELYDDKGNLIKTVKTDAKGSYKFEGIEPDKEYTVKFEVPQTYLVTKGGGDSDTNSLGVTTITPTPNGENEVDMGIICECDEYKLDPSKQKDMSASAFNLFSVLASLFILVLIARRED